MMPGHVVTYDGKLWIFTGASHVPAAHSGGPSNINYALAPFDDPGARVYVQDPPHASIQMIEGCAACDACPGWRCHPKCKVGTEARGRA